jgi:hypothetical protein
VIKDFVWSASSCNKLPKLVGSSLEVKNMSSARNLKTIWGSWKNLTSVPIWSHLCYLPGLGLFFQMTQSVASQCNQDNKCIILCVWWSFAMCKVDRQFVLHASVKKVLPEKSAITKYLERERGEGGHELFFHFLLFFIIRKFIIIYFFKGQVFYFFTFCYFSIIYKLFVTFVYSWRRKGGMGFFLHFLIFFLLLKKEGT